MSPTRPSGGSPGVPVLHVHLPDGRVLRFSTPFRIGRDADCEIRLQDGHVSRKHLAASFEQGVWWLRDLKSANGLFVGGKRTEAVSVTDSLSLTLGIDGPSVTFEVEGRVRHTERTQTPKPTVQTPERETKVLHDYEQRYFGGGSEEGMGGRTRMIRRAFDRVQKKQKRRYQVVVALIAIAAISASVVAYLKHQQLVKEREQAQEFFYRMKHTELQIAQLERTIAESATPEVRAKIQKLRAQRRASEADYDRLQAVRNLYDSNLSEEDRLILRVTRMFGECELAAPDEYLDLVKSYIRRWRSTERFARAVNEAAEKGYTGVIAEEFTNQNLPPQFFYLAMQESDFNPFASGPPTNWGIAKGMWQFIPDTGSRYGLKIGPFQKLPRPDPDDDRHDWRKATTAAAKYIKDIYSIDAQASGLLVMASYNWGENRVLRLIKSMPENPQERNFWKLVDRYRERVPGQTYDYVFSIVSAAVIGENPRLFGFDFDNPLSSSEQK